jgi:hypothetical protein
MDDRKPHTLTRPRTLAGHAARVTVHRIAVSPHRRRFTQLLERYTTHTPNAPRMNMGH